MKSMKGINQNIMAFYIPIDLCIPNDVSVGWFGVWFSLVSFHHDSYSDSPK